MNGTDNPHCISGDAPIKPQSSNLSILGTDLGLLNGFKEEYYKEKSDDELKSHRSKSLLYLIAVSLIDLGFSIFVSYSFIYRSPEYHVTYQCFNHDGVEYFRSDCSRSTESDIRRLFTGIVYYSGLGLTFVVIGLQYYDMEFQLNVLDNWVVKIAHFIRNLTLFNYLNVLSVYVKESEFPPDTPFTPSQDIDPRFNVVFFSVDAGDYWFVWTVGGSYILSALIVFLSPTYVFVNVLQSKYKDRLCQFFSCLLSTLIMGGVIWSLIYYVHQVNIMDQPITILYDKRGPKLQLVSILVYSTLLLSIFEYVMMTEIIIIRNQLNSRSRSLMVNE
jgi:hypothetical protein